MRPFRHCCTLLLALTAAGPAAAEIVRFDTNFGSFDVELSSDSALATTVNNFLAYVNDGLYANTIIHRSTIYNPTSIQIIQGGSYVLDGTTLNPVSTAPPIPLQAVAANLRGTIAMARTSDPNSATSGWFFNVTNNPGLDFNYAVFGAVVNTVENPGLSVIDAIAGLPVYDASAPLGPAFGELPLSAPSLQVSSLVIVNNVAVVPEPSTLALAAGGIGLALAAARRKRQIARSSRSDVRLDLFNV